MYFDPGIGSLIIQALIGIVAVCGGYLAFTKSKIKAFFSKNKEASDSNSNQTAAVNDAKDEEL